MSRQEIFVKLLSDTLDEETAKKLYIRLDQLPDEVLILAIDRLVDDNVPGEMSINEKFHTLYEKWRMEADERNT